MTDARATDVTTEVAITDTNPTARATDVASEVAITDTNPTARATDVASEVAISNANPAARATDVIAEVAMVSWIEKTVSDSVGLVDNTTSDATIELFDTIGVSDVVTRVPFQANHYIYENVGVTLTPDLNARHYIYENAGATLVPIQDARHYIYEGDVDTSKPQPHIWYVRPIAGPVGSTFQIVGHGFGATEATYYGKAFLGAQGGWSTPTPIDAAYRLAVSSWSQIAAAVNAYNNLCQLNEYSGEVDPEHQIIVVTVYAGAVTGLVRVQTI